MIKQSKYQKRYKKPQYKRIKPMIQGRGKESHRFGRRFLIIAGLALVGILGVGYLLFYSSVFKVKEVQVANIKDFPVGEVQTLAEKELKSNWVFLPKNSWFLAKTIDWQKVIASSFSMIKEIKSSLSLRNSKVVYLTLELRKPVVIFQDENAKESFLIDENGLAYDKLSTSTEYLKNSLPLVISLGSKEHSLLETVLDKEKMEQVFFAKNELEKLGLRIADFQIQGEDKLSIKTKNGFLIHFVLAKDMSSSFLKLKLILEKEIPKEKLSDLEYIDLRFSKAYYRYKD